MKGIVFTEFLDYVELAAGPDVLDDMIEAANVPSGAIYTAVGKYDYNEMVALVSALSQISGQPVATLVRGFGRHLFHRFAECYPQFFDHASNAFEFIESVEDRIHVEVVKLYPDAELPRLDAVRDGPDTLRIQYVSCRPFGELCVGLIEGCAAHFGEDLAIDGDATGHGLDLRVCRRHSRAA